MADGFDSFARANLEQRENWEHARQTAPWLKFPATWEVAIIPPFFGAMMRFKVRRGEATVSVYADYHEALGYFGEPHWEIYPDAEDNNARFPLADTEALIAEIRKSLNKQNRAPRSHPTHGGVS